ncbi:MAG: hypothetical protein ACYCUF_12365, partial [Acidimicrobiales bacterium]
FGQGPLGISGVVLLGRAEGGEVLVGGLSLVFDAHGLVVAGPAPGVQRMIPWPSILSLGTGAARRLPDGQPGVTLEVVTGERSIELLVPEAMLPAGGVEALTRALAGVPRAFAAGSVLPAPPPPPAPLGMAQPAPPAPMAPPGRWSPPAWGAPPPTPMAPPGTWSRAPWGAPPPAPMAPPGTWSRAPWSAPPPSFMAGALPPQPGRRPPGRRARSVLGLAAALVLLAVGGGIAWVLAGSSSSGGPRPQVHSPSKQELQAIAQGVNLTLSDMPSGWVVAGAGGGGPQPTKAQQQSLVAQFASCVHSSLVTAQEVIGGKAVPGEVDAGSPNFADAPQSPNQVSSSSSIVPSTSVVRREMSVVENPRFGSCSEEEIVQGLQLALPGKAAAAGGGAPRSQALPPVPGVNGIALVVPVMVSGPSGSSTVYFDGAIFAAGRVEGSVSAMSFGSPVSPALFSSLTRTVEMRTVAASRELGASVSAD